MFENHSYIEYEYYELINEEWISDKIRFNYDSYMNQRLINCMLILNDKFYYYSWLNSLIYYKKILLGNLVNFISNKNKYTEFYSIQSNFIDLNFLNLQY